MILILPVIYLHLSIVLESLSTLTWLDFDAAMFILRQVQEEVRPKGKMPHGL